ncbi:MAG: hypothetical protein R3F38_11980 [Gammaproteobacteria bacterium]
MEALRAALPAYMQPQKITVLDQLPVNANGKTDYHQLRQWLNADMS